MLFFSIGCKLSFDKSIIQLGTLVRTLINIINLKTYYNV